MVRDSVTRMMKSLSCPYLQQKAQGLKSHSIGDRPGLRTQRLIEQGLGSYCLG